MQAAASATAAELAAARAELAESQAALAAAQQQVQQQVQRQVQQVQAQRPVVVTVHAGVQAVPPTCNAYASTEARVVVSAGCQVGGLQDMRTVGVQAEQPSTLATMPNSLPRQAASNFLPSTLPLTAGIATTATYNVSAAAAGAATTAAYGFGADRLGLGVPRVAGSLKPLTALPPVGPPPRPSVTGPPAVTSSIAAASQLLQEIRANLGGSSGSSGRAVTAATAGAAGGAVGIREGGSRRLPHSSNGDENVGAFEKCEGSSLGCAAWAATKPSQGAGATAAVGSGTAPGVLTNTTNTVSAGAGLGAQSSAMMSQAAAATAKPPALPPPPAHMPHGALYGEPAAPGATQHQSHPHPSQELPTFEAQPQTRPHSAAPQIQPQVQVPAHSQPAMPAHEQPNPLGAEDSGDVVLVAFSSAATTPRGDPSGTYRATHNQGARPIESPAATAADSPHSPAHRIFSQAAAGAARGGAAGSEEGSEPGPVHSHFKVPYAAVAAGVVVESGADVSPRAMGLSVVMGLPHVSESPAVPDEARSCGSGGAAGGSCCGEEEEEEESEGGSEGGRGRSRGLAAIPFSLSHALHVPSHAAAATTTGGTKTQTAHAAAGKQVAQMGRHVGAAAPQAERQVLGSIPAGGTGAAGLSAGGVTRLSGLAGDLMGGLSLSRVHRAHSEQQEVAAAHKARASEQLVQAALRLSAQQQQLESLKRAAPTSTNVKVVGGTGKGEKHVFSGKGSRAGDQAVASGSGKRQGGAGVQLMPSVAASSNLSLSALGSVGPRGARVSVNRRYVSDS